jgi:hypothetical protein
LSRSRTVDSARRFLEFLKSRRALKSLGRREAGVKRILRGRPELRERERRVRNTLVILLIAVSGLVVVLLPLLPVTFSDDIALYVGCTLNCPAELFHSQSLPPGVVVSLRWADETGGSVMFTVSGPLNFHNVLLSQCSWFNTTSGDCTFLSLGGSYYFGARVSPGTSSNQEVNYTGTYLSPLI